ncbi:hypothetical protein [Ancylobacter terrae]|uniref:hypothetical protein n=1 Tax=Ancylobacter sp. sgz301288 TaxID=3342077 RepID=UPI00385865BA
MNDEYIGELQSAINEASLLLECCAFLTEAEHPNPARWRDAVAILHGVMADRLRAASRAVARMEGTAE